ncbi:MAG: GH116 family glycosyl-hydrolase, partial [Thermoguttaceae bacterium]|nr:GH116 family glycosyl-hydrolase [Thermoguttaceae bacterium]
MSDHCCCQGRCGDRPLVSLSRREFLEWLAAGTAGWTLAELGWARAGEPAAPAAPKAPRAKHAMTPPRVYRGKHLEAVAMPLGGIGTGSIWLDGQGRLAVWQIFNNLSEPRIPDSFFGVRVLDGAGKSVTRVLQTVAEGPFAPVASLSYEGGYPIARLSFDDPALPIAVRLEGFNPMIPLDAANSSIPTAIFRLSARNTGKAPVEVTLFGTLQNAVGSQGAANIQGVRHPAYGGNRNRVVREAGFTAVAMDQAPGPRASGPV